MRAADIRILKFDTTRGDTFELRIDFDNDWHVGVQLARDPAELAHQLRQAAALIERKVSSNDRPGTRAAA